MIATNFFALVFGLLVQTHANAVTQEVCSPARVAEVLRTCPDWTRVSDVGSSDQRRRIVMHLLPLLSVEPDSFKRGVLLFLETPTKSSPDWVSGTAMIVTRMYLDIPDCSGILEGSVSSFKRGRGENSMLWPLSLKGGHLELTGSYHGTGSVPYMFQIEFESLSKHHMRRQR